MDVQKEFTQELFDSLFLPFSNISGEVIVTFMLPWPRWLWMYFGCPPWAISGKAKEQTRT